MAYNVYILLILREQIWLNNNTIEILDKRNGGNTLLTNLFTCDQIDISGTGYFETVNDAPQMANALHEDAIFFHEATGFSENFWDDHNYVKLTLKERNSLVLE